MTRINEQQRRDPAKKAQYKAAAGSVIDHVRLLALLRMQVVQQDVINALTNLFLKVLLPTLGTLLKAVF